MSSTYTVLTQHLEGVNVAERLVEHRTPRQPRVHSLCVVDVLHAEELQEVILLIIDPSFEEHIDHHPVKHETYSVEQQKLRCHRPQRPANVSRMSRERVHTRRYQNVFSSLESQLQPALRRGQARIRAFQNAARLWTARARAGTRVAASQSLAIVFVLPATGRTRHRAASSRYQSTRSPLCSYAHVVSRANLGHFLLTFPLLFLFLLVRVRLVIANFVREVTLSREQRGDAQNGAS